MGTRSLTFVYEKYGQVQKPVVNMYRQFDGYPTGHGAELAEFLSSGTMVNGLGVGSKTLQFNGMGCLAAQMVAHFKQTPGGFYIHPVDITECGQDYEYHIYCEEGLLSGSVFRIEVYNCGCNFFGVSGDSRDLEFKGSLEEFTEFCKDKEKTGVVEFGSIDELKSVLLEDIATVTFKKNDGTNRVMRCTLNSKFIPEVPSLKSVNIRPARNTSNEVLPVFDLDADGWRSFRFDSIIKVEREVA